MACGFLASSYCGSHIHTRRIVVLCCSGGFVNVSINQEQGLGRNRTGRYCACSPDLYGKYRHTMDAGRQYNRLGSYPTNDLGE